MEYLDKEPLELSNIRISEAKDTKKSPKGLTTKNCYFLMDSVDFLNYINTEAKPEPEEIARKTTKKEIAQLEANFI